jgi:hypothetical protein
MESIDFESFEKLIDLKMGPVNTEISYIKKGLDGYTCSRKPTLFYRGYFSGDQPSLRPSVRF